MYSKCELLAEEGMKPDLFELVFQQENRLNYLNKYGFLLSKSKGTVLLFLSPLFE